MFRSRSGAPEVLLGVALVLFAVVGALASEPLGAPVTQAETALDHLRALDDKSGGDPHLQARIRDATVALDTLRLNQARAHRFGGPFSGKFELVPLFDNGHRPVISNRHQEYAERNTWTFTRPNGERITVRAGRVTDLASIPAIVWPVLPPDGPYAQGTGGHDECYKSKGFLPADRTRPTPYDRPGCDELLREMMVALQVPSWKRVVIFEAVRTFGGVGWGR